MILDFCHAAHSRALKLGPPPPAVPNKAIKAVCYLSILTARALLPVTWKFNQPGLKPRTDGKPKIIVSMTSYPPRIKEAWRAIESLMRQKHMPDRIVLWLSAEEFPTINMLPRKLLRLQSRGLEIRLMPGNLKSHKKYIYIFKENPDDYIMLVDDDTLYPSDSIERLLRDMTPQRVHVNFSHTVTYGKDGRPLPYKNWIRNTPPGASPEQFCGTGGGTLLMPSSLPPITLDSDFALKLCPLADDIWVNAMIRMAGLTIHKVQNEHFLPTKIDRGPKLCSVNVDEGMNDAQLRRVIERFPQLFRAE